MATTGTRSNQYIQIASVIASVIGILNILAIAFLSFLLFIASASLPADTPGLSFVWLVVFVIWGYAIAITWSAFAIRNGSKTGWVILVVALGLSSISFLFAPRAGLFGTDIVRFGIGLSSVVALVLLIIPPSYRWIWSPPEATSVLPGNASPGIGRGGWAGAAQQQFPPPSAYPPYARGPQYPPAAPSQQPPPPAAPQPGSGYGQWQ